MHSVLIVDDEAPARAELRYLLRGFPGVRVAAEAATLAEARAALAGRTVDLVFLDVNLLGEDGFDLVGDIVPPTVFVFVTAHAKFEPRARRMNAFGYLLKPVAPEQLSEILRRLGAVCMQRPDAALPPGGNEANVSA